MNQSAEEIRKKIFWVSLFRIFILFLLLFSTLVITRYIRINVLDLAKNALIWGTFVALFPSIVYIIIILFITGRNIITPLIYLQFFQDVLFSGFIVFITGGTGSGFTFMHPLVIIMTSIFLFRSGAMIFATVSCCTLAVIGLIEIGKIGAGSALIELIPFKEDTPTIIYSLIVNAISFYSIAYLSSYLSEQVRESDILRKQIIAKMEDLKILHRLILSSISVGIVTIDENKKILYINESGERLLKTSGEKAEKKSIYQIIPEVAEKIEKGADEFEYQIVRSHDPPVILGMSISPLLNHMKEKIGYLLIIQDISDLKRMEERMKHEERMSTVGKLASVVAHEIRNPLASISGSVQLIEAIENLSEEDRHLLKIVVREIDHLNHWISDLLEFSKVSPGGWNVFDLHALVSQIVEMMKLHEENAETEFVVNGEENFPVYGDQSQIKIAIMNIIRNANEAMTADNRTITIDFVKKEMKGKEFAVLDIVDKGEGIPADVLPRIFEPFFTTKEKGTGLGLATVRRIIEDHGGEIMVESTVQKGTKFTLVLPIHKG